MTSLSNIQSQASLVMPVTSMDSDFQSPPIYVAQCNGYYIQMAITGGGNNSGTAKLQTQVSLSENPEDLDPNLWADYEDSQKTLVGTETVAAWEVVTEKHQWVRVDWDASAGTGSSAEILAFKKTTSA